MRARARDHDAAYAQARAGPIRHEEAVGKARLGLVFHLREIAARRRPDIQAAKRQLSHRAPDSALRSHDSAHPQGKFDHLTDAVQALALICSASQCATTASLHMVSGFSPSRNLNSKRRVRLGPGKAMQGRRESQNTIWAQVLRSVACHDVFQYAPRHRIYRIR